MSLLQITILSIVQGLSELLPVSSSAHVIVAEKIMGLDPSSPAMTLLLVMLHTGTMLAVIVYFWQRWRRNYFQSWVSFKTFAARIVLATLLTGVIGEVCIKIIEKIRGGPRGQIEDLFSHLEIIAPALAVAGILIVLAGILEEKQKAKNALTANNEPTAKQVSFIGAIQGVCLPFRGLSRSGATISVGMLAGVAKCQAESFSFALAVVLTPAVVYRETVRLIDAEHISGAQQLASAALPSLLGSGLAFLAGLVALKWLSEWLESGRWYLFGIYCLVAAMGVAYLHRIGY
jgi:undecaprenyl-diphosphatase